MTCDKEKKNDIGDGGVAFPNPLDGDGYPPLKYGYGGMSLRDYFAGRALTGLLTSHEVLMEAKDIASQNGCNREDVFAHWAYRQADAMLAARDSR